MATEAAGAGYHPIREDLRHKIHRVHGYDTKNGYTYYPVVVVGAGLAGVAMAHRLQVDMKFDQFRVFERQAGVGGTWWINRCVLTTEMLV
jgi:ribulose 1,5-bisphosphate synthetase/thiazole synthase